MIIDYFTNEKLKNGYMYVCNPASIILFLSFNTIANIESFYL